MRPIEIEVVRSTAENEVVETALMLECDAHPNIVKLFKIQQFGPSSYVAMERGDCSLLGGSGGGSAGLENIGGGSSSDCS